DFAPFVMAHDPLKMNIDDAKRETKEAWTRSYSAERNRQAIDSIQDSPIDVRISHLVARLFFRGIYFPQMSRWAWIRLLLMNRSIIFSLAVEGLSLWRDHRKLNRPTARTVPTLTLVLFAFLALAMIIGLLI